MGKQNCQILICVLGSWVSRRTWEIVSDRARPNQNASAFQVVRQNVPPAFICLRSFRRIRFAAFDSNYSALVSSSSQVLKERYANPPRTIT